MLFLGSIPFSLENQRTAGNKVYTPLPLTLLKIQKAGRIVEVCQPLQLGNFSSILKSFVF